MTKCGKSFMPECEYFTTGGCVSPFNCMYKEESGYINSATSGTVVCTGGMNMPDEKIIENLKCGITDIDISEQCEQLKAENAELRARLEKAVELPVNIGDKIWEIFDNTLIFERYVYHIGLSENRTTFWLTGESGVFYLGEVELTDYKNIWFTTRAEAEARLKELQGGENADKA